ncbi:MAG: hypothetical protein KDD38_10025, partial [Bdellovibrionales bacterium]|nr:hypothetical protein [Bdellovibrionales bacterium]
NQNMNCLFQGTRMSTILLHLSILTLLTTSLGAYADDDSCKKALSKSAFQEEGAISVEWVDKMKSEKPSPLQNRVNEAVQNAGIAKVAMNREVMKNHNTSYTNEVPLGCGTDQKQSGRCWIFAGNNMLRAELLTSKKTDKTFSLSHNYLHFFNMLEKSNRWLWNVEEAQLQNLTRREELKFIESDPLGDGGWYVWYQFLVAKYGMVPQQYMPDTESSISTATLNQTLKTILSDAGVKIKILTHLWNSKATGAYSTKQKELLSDIRQEAMEKIFRILETNLGTPPSSFEFTNLKTKKTETYTPHTFRDKFIKYKADDYVTVANNARRPRNQYYEFIRSTIGVPELNGKDYPIRVLNISFERMDELIRSSIDAGRPMWFATDVGKFLEATPESLSKPSTGIWHPDIYKYSEVYNMPDSQFQLDALTQTEFRLSIPNHAMVIVAYDKPDVNGLTVKYKIENSWGDKWADKGYGHMYREWAELYLAEVVVHKSMLTPDELELIKATPKEILEDDFY